MIKISFIRKNDYFGKIDVIVQHPVSSSGKVETKRMVINFCVKYSVLENDDELRTNDDVDQPQLRLYMK